MPRIEFSAVEGGGWKPLPTATYDIMIDAVEPGLSKKQKAQIKVSGHVVDGPKDGKKVTLWYGYEDGGGWKLQALLDAAGVDYESEDTGEVDDEGRPVKALAFDSDDLPGATVRYDVEAAVYEGKDVNRFNKERAIEAVEKKAVAKPTAAAAVAKPKPKPTAAAAEEDEGSSDEEEEVPAAEPAPRRRQVRTATA